MAMAQAAHAANQFVALNGNNIKVKEDWLNEKTPHFGTTIVLSVDYQTLTEIIIKAGHKGIICGQVVDTTYPFVTDREIASLIPLNNQTSAAIYKDDGQVVMFREEITCGYIFVIDESSDQIELVGDLPLY